MIFNIFSLSSGLGAVIVLAVLYAMFKKKALLLLFLFLLFLIAEYFTGILMFIISLQDPGGFSVIPRLTVPVTVLLIIKSFCQSGMFLSMIFSVHAFLDAAMGRGRKILLWTAAGIVFIFSVYQVLRISTGAEGQTFLFLLPMFINYAGNLYAFFFLLISRNRQKTGFPGIIRKTACIGIGIFIPLMAFEDIYLFLSPEPPRVLIDPLAFLFLTGTTLLLSVLYLARTSRGIIAEKSIEDFCSDHGVSDREGEILRLLLQGLTYKAIGEKLFISQDTVKTHISRLYRKTGAAGRTDLKYKIRMIQP